jgi:hypothetical protein
MKMGGWLLVLGALTIGCGGGDDEMDGGLDVPGESMDTPSDVPLDVPLAMDVDVGQSCEGVEQGTTACVGGNGRSCCGGYWRMFYDGPCWGLPDAGSPDANGEDAGTPCDREPRGAGCPCTEEGTTMCVGFSWQRVCTDGVWLERPGYSCCVGL